MGEHHQTKVFVRDQAYGWLPASIDSIKEGQAFVRIELPSDWHSTTVLCEDSGLEEVEDSLATGHRDESPPGAFRSVALEAYANSQLPLQNKGGNISDMTLLPHLHEAAMLYNLKERNSLGLPYTRVRDIIVAVNPLRHLEKTHSLETQRYYASKILLEQVASNEEEEKMDAFVGCTREQEVSLEPHIYEISCLAYREMVLDGQDQAILVTGESGSGKTETIKLLLQHLTMLGDTHPSEIDASELARKVLRSTSLLEAFGNAKTCGNINSSRFGKLVRLQYSFNRREGQERPRDSFFESLSTCTLRGSICTTFLVEKTRVFENPIVGERNFDILFQLLSAPESLKRQLWSFFGSAKPSDYLYLTHFGECCLEGLNDYENDDANWKQTQIGLATFNIHGDLLLSMMRSLAIVLQLGNIVFVELNTEKGEAKTVITSKVAFTRLCTMIAVDEQELEMCFTSISVTTSNDEISAPQNPGAAKKATNALAAAIYASIFSYIVQQVNEQLSAKNGKAVCGSILLLDICGFERLATNRFEQLCINYANEQFQQKYVADNFRLLKLEYDLEGIDIFDYSVVDNSEVLSLCDGPTGLFAALQEQCTCPMGKDASVVQLFRQRNMSHTRLVNNALQTEKEFCIRHFAGPVSYDASNFVDRNLDAMPVELFACFAKTPNGFLRNQLQTALVGRENVPSSEIGSSKKAGSIPTIAQKFRSELRDLISIVEETRTRYIRCIIPNETLSPGVTNHLLILRQLECAGLMTSVALARESLPDCLSFTAFLSRFLVLLGRNDLENVNEMSLPDKIVYLLTNLFMPMFHGNDSTISTMPFACGKTKVYLRAGALNHLETMRYRFYVSRAVLIQTWFRDIQVTRRHGLFCMETQHLARRHMAASHILSWWRKRKCTYSELWRAAGLIQSRWRSKQTLLKHRKSRKAVSLLQRKVRARRRSMNRLHVGKNIPDKEVKQYLSTRRASLPSCCQDEHAFSIDYHLSPSNLSVVNANLTISGSPLSKCSSRSLATLAVLSTTGAAAKGNRTENTSEEREVVAREKFRKLQGLARARYNEATGEKKEVRTLHGSAGGEFSGKFSRCSAQKFVLREKLRHREQAHRLEKGFLCKMLDATEKSSLKVVQNLREEILGKCFLEQKIRVERENLQAVHDKETNSLLRRAACVANEKESYILKLEWDDKSQQAMYREENDSLRQTIASLKEQNKLDMRHWGTVASENKKLRESLESSSFNYKEEIHQLREELFWSQESQKQLESELGELETSHTKELGMAKLEVSEENARLRERIDSQERSLRNEKEAHQIEVCKLSDELLCIQNSQRQMQLHSDALKTVHAAELESLTKKTHDYINNDSVIAHLNGIIKDQGDHIEGEKERIRQQLKAHFEEVRGLREAFVQAQESHKKDLLQISGCLEAADMHRAKEVAHFVAELEFVKSKKNEICQEPAFRLSSIEEDIDPCTTRTALRTARACLEHESSIELTDLKSFATTLKRLQCAVKPENLKYIMDKIEENHDPDAEAKVLGEIYRMALSLGEMHENDRN